MLVNVTSFNTGEVIDKYELDSKVFGASVRIDLIKSVIDWQLLKRMSGTKSRKNLSEVSGTGKKPFAQKGTGRARQGTSRAPHMRGGCSAQPVSTVHAIKLNKKIRKLGLISILSEKVVSGNLVVVDNLVSDKPSSKSLANLLKRFDSKSFCLVTGSNVNDNLLKSVRNVPKVLYLSHLGANVYDILKHQTLILDINCIKELQNRLTQ